MRIKSTCKHIAVYILAALLVLSTSMSSPGLQVYASGATSAGSLIGTGAAGELNIIKILDMALNKAGMSMSPSKIREFLQYWWSSVSADLQTLVNDAGTTVTTVSDFVDYVASAAADPTKADGLEMAQLTLRFARFCATQDIKTLADYKSLITQEGMFRKFLLSYVTDSEGNVTESIGNNKLAKYNLKSDFINMVRQAADAYIEEYEGYYLVRSFTYKDFPVTAFDSKEKYDFICNTFKTATSDGVYLLQNFSGIKIYQASGYAFIGSFLESSERFKFSTYTYDWDYVNIYSASITDFSTAIDLSGYNPASSSNKVSIPAYQDYIMCGFESNGRMSAYQYLVTADGRMIRIWKTLDGFKNYSVGRQNIYYTNTYSSYDSSVDNSVQFTGSYYSNSSTNYSHEIIQNTIDNSQEVIDESTVNNITNQTVYNITNNYYADSSGDDDPDDKPGGWWNIGEGISAFIEGVASLLDFILKLLGDLVGLLGKFLTSVLDVLSSLTALGQGFGDFLGAAFAFLPEECISLIVSSIAAMCVVGVVKAFIK